MTKANPLQFPITWTGSAKGDGSEATGGRAHRAPLPGCAIGDSSMRLELRLRSLFRRKRVEQELDQHITLSGPGGHGGVETVADTHGNTSSLVEPS